MRRILRTLRYDGELRFALVRRRLGAIHRPSSLSTLLCRLPRAVQQIPLRVPRIWFARYPVTDVRIVRDTTPFLGDGFSYDRVRFSHPYGIAAAEDGAFVVADTFKNRVILFTEDGDMRLCLHHAQEGRVPLIMPMAVVLDHDGRIVVLNSGAGMLHRYHQKGRYLDDPASIEHAMLMGARGLCVGNDGTIFVAATRRHRVLAIPAAGGRAWDQERTDLGRFPFAFPMGVAQAESGEIAVCDTFNHRVALFADDGAHLRTLGGLGLDPGLFNGPAACAYLKGGVLLVLEWAGNRLQAFAPDGSVIGEWGRYGSWLLGREIGELSLAGGLAVDRGRARVLLADTHNHRIQRFNASTVLSVPDARIGRTGSAGPPCKSAGAGSSEKVFWGPDALPASIQVDFVRAIPLGMELKSPQGLTAVGRDSIWIADTFHNRMVRWSRAGGEIVAFGGLGKELGEFINPTDAALVGQDVLVVDSLNSRLQRFGMKGECRGQVDALTSLEYPRSISYQEGYGLAVVETVPGRLTLYGEDHKPKWRVSRADGNIQQPAWVRWHEDLLYVADIELHRIVVFGARGEHLGSWGGLSDDPAGLNHPYSIEFISQRVCAVADAGNHRIQFYAPGGRWLRTWSGESEESRLFYPRGLLWLEDERRLIVADSERHRLVEFDLALNYAPASVETPKMGGLQ